MEELKLLDLGKRATFSHLVLERPAHAASTSPATGLLKFTSYKEAPIVGRRFAIAMAATTLLVGFIYILKSRVVI
jgi:hypothetical protein